MSNDEAHYLIIPWDVVVETTGKMFFVVIENRDDLKILAEELAKQKGYGEPLRYRITLGVSIEIWFAKSLAEIERERFDEFMNRKTLWR